jgi:UDP-4-amino-4,6-dideoxy-N-acetyl-beta-L-altrosamine N-acetyltransferase
MYTDREISPQEHAQWYEHASQDNMRSLLIFECDKRAQGFVNLHRVADWGLGEWGFYAAPGAIRGTGRALGEAALDYAFNTLQLHKICGEVIANNIRSLRLHEMLGFQREGILREQHFDGKKHWDVHCFGLLANEWCSIYPGKDL